MNPDAHAQGTSVIVQIAPATAQVGVGQTIDLVVEVVNVQGMYGFDVDLSFDPNAVEVVDADPSIAGVQASLGTFMESGFVIINQADNFTGSLRFAMTQLNPSVAKSGTGNLVVVRVRGKQASTISEIKLNSVQIAKVDGSEIYTSLNSGQIQVVQNIPGPTNTSVPTQGAGTPMPPNTTTAPIQGSSTQRSPSSNPTSTIKPTLNTAGQAVPSTTNFPSLTSTDSVLDASLATPSASSSVVLSATMPEPTQSPPIAWTLTSETESSTPNLMATSTTHLKKATFSATELALNAVTQTQMSPTQTASRNVFITTSIIGMALSVGLGVIFFGLVIGFIVMKLRRSS